MADVVISITIPSAYVSRLQAAVEGSIYCDVVDENGIVINTLGPKECLKRKIVNELVDFINRYEEKIAKQLSKDAYNTVYNDWTNSYVPVPVN